MKLLVKGTEIYEASEHITRGIFDEPFEKWRIADAENNLKYFMIDNGLTLIDNVTLPDDYEHGTYTFENGAFVKVNVETIPTIEERVAELENKMTELLNK